MKPFRIPVTFLIVWSGSFAPCMLRAPSGAEAKAKSRPTNIRKRKLAAATLSDVSTSASLGSSSAAASSSSNVRVGPSYNPVRNRAGPITSLARRKQWRRRARSSVAINERAMYLARSTVKELTAAAYISAVAAFESFCRNADVSLATLPLIDSAMEKYFTHCFFDGVGPAHGRNVLYGWLHLKTNENSNKGQRLPKSSCALRGWNKRCKGHVRDPLPWCFVCLIALFFLEAGKVLLALAVLLQVDTYLRPSELLDLALGSFSPPTPLAGRTYDGAWTLVIAPAFMDVCTKTGLVDCSVLVGDKIRQFLQKALVAYGLGRGGSATALGKATVM